MVPVLSSCAGFDPSKLTGNYKPQDYAGITWVEHISPDGTTVRWRDGKDKSLLGVTMTLPDGTSFAYNADEVLGEKASALRGEVQRALAGEGVEASAATVDAVIRALRPERMLLP
jgi:hypothetical protein